MISLKKLSDEEKNEIIQFYSTSNLSAKRICQQYGISAHSLNALIKEAGIEFRRPYQVGNARAKQKRKACPVCGSKKSPSGSKFCCDCGNSLYTQKEIIISKLENLTEYFNLFHSSKRDRYIEEINTIINEVKKLSTKGE